jgi:hypothetical protein
VPTGVVEDSEIEATAASTRRRRRVFDFFNGTRTGVAREAVGPSVEDGTSRMRAMRGGVNNLRACSC